MKLEDQFAPLELARRMKELGFPQDGGLAFWASKDEIPSLIIHGDEEDTGYHPELCAAPTVAEIGEALGEFESGCEPTMEPNFWAAVSTIRPAASAVASGMEDVTGATEAEARARLWIALAEAKA
jgi:hypothetical protein